MSHPRKIDTRRPRGTRITDFKIGSTLKRHPGKVTKKRVKRQKWHGLAEDLDEFREFGTRVLQLPLRESEDTDDTDDADDTSLLAANINPDWRVESLEDSSGERFLTSPEKLRLWWRIGAQQSGVARRSNEWHHQLHTDLRYRRRMRGSAGSDWATPSIGVT